MAEQIKTLIEKIQREGIQAGEAKAQSIESEARQRSDEILAKARAEAGRIVKDAAAEAQKNQNSMNAVLKQAGRDVLLNLKSEISAILNKVVLHNVRASLSGEELSKMLLSLVREGVHHQDIVINLSKDDLHKLEKHFMGELAEGLKKHVVLKPSDDISAGFVISYDAGRSHYDFTDQALAGYIISQLKPELAKILEQ